MTKTTIAAQDVRAGQVVIAHGYRWTVESNEFDPRGNTGNQPRHVLHCRSADGKAPVGYADQMALGFLVGARVTVETTQ